MFTFDLLANAIVAGVLLGGFYTAVSLGLTIAFGRLDVVNIAHPAFVILGSYTAYMVNAAFGVDPVLAGLAFTPAFFAIGVGIYRVYHASFERRGDESLRGLAFFFGLMFIVEVALILVYGVDYRLVDAPYIGATVSFGFVGVPMRMLVPFALALIMTIALQQYFVRTFMGRAIMAVSQDRLALQLMGADPTRVKQLAFGIALATASLAGAMLIVIGPVEPSMGRLYIGRVFAIVVLGGMGSVGGTLIAALLLGVIESLTATFYGPSWAPAVAFGFLLFALAVRPQGLFGR
ncbi:MAG: branched-chain amino acid ABC transporter permease [Alphaproteobacteria bacterium]|nr:branched-chain amino acid ABC transporter permease [Alphaproteobacteria bacterium]MDP6516962.1 branched-chain amino acid ABC transporter permease [Alphaproteobacteria bacterium]